MSGYSVSVNVHGSLSSNVNGINVGHVSVSLTSPSGTVSFDFNPTVDVGLFSGVVPGIVSTDVNITGSTSYSLSITQSQYESMQDYAVNSLNNPKDYSLFGYACNNFVSDVLSRAGLDYDSFEIPSSLVGPLVNGRIARTRGISTMHGFHCFPASTLISLPSSASTPISAIRPGDEVLAFDPAAKNGTGALVPRRVTRLFENVTEEWITVTFADGTSITATPGHHMLAADGRFRELGQMIAPDGSVTLIAEDGSIITGRAERIIYSAATAHFYEETEMLVYSSQGGLALQPEMKKGWKTYNFEVEEFHTYIADGIRVHNDSLDEFNSLSIMLGNQNLHTSAYNSLVNQFGLEIAAAAAWGGSPPGASVAEINGLAAAAPKRRSAQKQRPRVDREKRKNILFQSAI